MIDAHHHVWDLEAREHRWLMGSQPWASDEELARLRRSFGLAELAPLAAASGVTGTVVVQTVTEPWETPDLLGLAAGAAVPPGSAVPPGGGLLAGVVGWTDLAAPSAAEAVAGLRALPGGSFLCGIRHPLLTEPDPGWLARPLVVRGLAALAAAGLCFDLVLRPDQLASAIGAARSSTAPPGASTGSARRRIDGLVGCRGEWAGVARVLPVSRGPRPGIRSHGITSRGRRSAGRRAGSPG